MLKYETLNERYPLISYNSYYMSHKSWRRHKTALIILLLTSFAITSSIAQKTVEQQLSKEIGKILRYEIEWDKKETPGFLVIVVEPDTSFTVKFGNEITGKEEINDERLFGIGGLSKVYSSIAVAHAIIEGKLDTSKVIEDVFPETHLIKSTKIIDLIQHTAGYPRTLKLINVNRKNDYEQVSKEEYFNALKSNKLNIDGGFKYNHHDVVALEEWLIKETGEDIKFWYESAQKVYPTLPSWRDQEDGIKGIDINGNERNNIKYGVYQSSLGLFATKDEMEDLLRFLLLENPVSSFIKSNEIKTGIKKGVNFSNGLYKIANGKKYTIYGHGGRSINNSASLHFVPETKTGLIILTNSQSGVKQLYLPILSMINNNWRR